MKVRYSYRLRPGRRAEAALVAEWDRCRWVWNRCVETSRAAHLAGGTCGPGELDRTLTGWRRDHDWLGEGSSVAQQQTVRDFSFARHKALMDRKSKIAGRRRGLPKFKSRHRALPTLNYTRRGFSLRPDGGGRVRLCLPGGVIVPVVWSRDLPSDPTSARVRRDSLGHWYVSFVVEAFTEPLPVPDGAVPLGIDWGVTETATATDAAFDLVHHQRAKAAAKRLAYYQRRMARRRPPRGKPGSNGYQRAKTDVAKAHKKVARQRSDDHRKWAKKIVRAHDQIACEDFRPKFLASTRMAAKSADAGIASAKASLISMAAKHERDLRLIPPAYTTTDCSSCGARAKRLPLSERTYRCNNCGLVCDRDRNSAAVMVARSGFVPAGADGIRPGEPPGSQAA